MSIQGEFLAEPKRKIGILHLAGTKGFATAFAVWKGLNDIHDLSFMVGTTETPAYILCRDFAAAGGEEVFYFSEVPCLEAWRQTNGEEPFPEILLYVADRGTWNLEHSREINAFIAQMPQTFTDWDNFYMPEAYDAGRAILRFASLTTYSVADILASQE